MAERDKGRGVFSDPIGADMADDQIATGNASDVSSEFVRRGFRAMFPLEVELTEMIRFLTVLRSLLKKYARHKQGLLLLRPVELANLRALVSMRAHQERRVGKDERPARVIRLNTRAAQNAEAPAAVRLPFDSSAAQLDQGFSQFWAAYPKKVDKVAAKGQWEALGASPSLIKVILEAVHANCRTREWQLEGGRYVPNPARWLAGRRWEDERQERCTATALSETWYDECKSRHQATCNGRYAHEIRMQLDSARLERGAS